MLFCFCFLSILFFYYSSCYFCCFILITFVIYSFAKDILAMEWPIHSILRTWKPHMRARAIYIYPPSHNIPFPTYTLLLPSPYKYRQYLAEYGSPIYLLLPFPLTSLTSLSRRSLWFVCVPALLSLQVCIFGTCIAYSSLFVFQITAASLLFRFIIHACLTDVSSWLPFAVLVCFFLSLPFIYFILFFYS